MAAVLTESPEVGVLPFPGAVRGRDAFFFTASLDEWLSVKNAPGGAFDLRLDAVGRPAVGVACSPEASPSGRALARSCLSGAAAMGGRVWDFGECVESQFDFCLGMSRADYGVYIGAGASEAPRVSRWNGGASARGWEAGQAAFRNLPKLYPFELMKLCDAGLEGLAVRVESSSRAARELLEEVLRRLGCSLHGEGALTIRLSPDGRAAAVSGGRFRLSESKVLETVAVAELLHGRCVALPCGAPLPIEQLAERYGGRAVRYSETARAKAAAQPWLRDGMMLAVKLLSFLSELSCGG